MKNPKLAGHRPHAREASFTAEPSLGRDIQSKIGQQLRAMYDEVVSQGVPTRFVDLLDRLEKRNDKGS
jgi:anti-sigma factor NepR-like protein